MKFRTISKRHTRALKVVKNMVPGNKNFSGEVFSEIFLLHGKKMGKSHTWLLSYRTEEGRYHMSWDLTTHCGGSWFTVKSHSRDCDGETSFTDVYHVVGDKLVTDGRTW